MQKMGLRAKMQHSAVVKPSRRHQHVINFCPDTKCYGDFLALDKAATNWLHKLNIDVYNCRHQIAYERTNESGGKHKESTEKKV